MLLPRRIRFFLSLVIGSILLGGCASSYNPINPERLSYKNPEESAALLLSYKYDVLSLAGNKKYPKKERKKGLRLVAIKIENQGFRDIEFNSLNFFQGDRPVDLLNTYALHKSIKQGVVEYLFYGLIIINISKTETTNGHVNTNTTIIPIGLAIAAGNMIGAGSANANFKKELIKYDLKGKTIPAGESVIGLIGFFSNDYAPITIKY